MRALILALLLVGCADPQIIYKDRIVEVPVVITETCPSLPKVESIDTLPVDGLNKDSSNTDVARAYVKTVEICRNKMEQYKEALEVPNE